MQTAFAAFARALRDLTQPRILAVVFLPMGAAIALWIALSWVFWGHWTEWLSSLVQSTAAARWLNDWGAGWVLRSMSALVVVLLLIPATLVTAMILTEIVAMPVIISHVGDRYYTALEKRAGGTVTGSILNATVGIAIFCVLWVVTLPLWLIGIGAVLVPVLTSAYLNQRLFRYDALADYASTEEYRALRTHARSRLFLLGILLSLLLYVPLVNLLVPVLSGLAFTHLCLQELTHLRAQSRNNPVV